MGLLLQIATAPPTGESAVDFTWLFLKMLLVLGIVTVLAVLVLKYAVPHVGIIKRLQRSRYFEIMGRQIIEPGRSLYLVKACGKYIVLGVSAQGVNRITDVSDEDVKLIDSDK